MNFQQFVDWALAQGTVAKYNDGQFAGECVSLINQYCWRVLNVPADAWGHAVDWARNAMPLKYFSVVTGAREGDILVYGGTPTNPYGHIEIKLNDTESLFQNRNYNRRVGYGKSLANPIAVLRLKPEFHKQTAPAKPKPVDVVPMITPRVLIASTDLHKFDPDTKEFSSHTGLKRGEYRFFSDKFELNGVTYVRTDHDKKLGNRLGFDFNKMIELPSTSDVVRSLWGL